PGELAEPERQPDRQRGVLREDPDRRPVQQERPGRRPVRGRHAGGARPFLLPLRRGRGERGPRHHRDIQARVEADVRRSHAAALETRLAAESEARRAAGSETNTALASLSARAEKLYQEIAAVLRQVLTLEASLNEKTSQGLREAEDIRAQIAPLLEAGTERRA